MSEEKRMLGNYEVVNSIYIGDKEVVFGVDKSDKYPFLVSYCDYHNPFGVPWATESVGCDDYLEAMGIFIQRVQSQIEKTKSELSKFAFDNTVFTKDHCIPDKRSSSIVGKVVVINAEPKRYEYQHPAFQLVLADGGNGATGGRGNAVFGTCLATGEKSRWERYDVLGEIKPECMPDWAKEALAKIKEQQKEKKQKDLEKFFELGYSTKGENRGIGLYDVKMLVDKQRGNLIFESIVRDELDCFKIQIIL